MNRPQKRRISAADLSWRCQLCGTPNHSRAGRCRRTDCTAKRRALPPGVGERQRFDRIHRRKNKPKPSLPYPGSATSARPATSNTSNSQSSVMQDSANDVTCATCTFRNSQSNECCAMCESKLPEPVWYCGACTVLNRNPIGLACWLCGSERNRDLSSHDSSSLPSHSASGGMRNAPLGPSAPPSNALDDDTEEPSYLVCPLTMEVFTEPVLAADSVTYERAAIIEWFDQQTGTGDVLSPMTGTMMPRTLVLNRALKEAAEEFRAKHNLNVVGGEKSNENEEGSQEAGHGLDSGKYSGAQFRQSNQCRDQNENKNSQEFS